jgi:hypothetical protein
MPRDPFIREKFTKHVAARKLIKQYFERSPKAARLVFNSPTQRKVASSVRGRSKRASAVTHKAITLQFVVPTAVAIALGIMISIGAVKYFVPIDQAQANHSVAGSREIAELPNPHLSRVRLLLSSMK